MMGGWDCFGPRGNADAASTRAPCACLLMSPLYCAHLPIPYNPSMPHLFSIRSLKDSPIYIGYLISIHFFAFACIAMVLPNALYVIALFCLIMSFLFFLERDQEIITLEYAQKTEWIVHCHDDQVVRMQLLPSSVMMRYFLVLHFKGDNEYKKTLVLFSDMFLSENYRHFRRCVKQGFL